MRDDYYDVIFSGGLGWIPAMLLAYPVGRRLHEETHR